MVHVALGLFEAEPVQLLLVAHGAQGQDRQGLGLPACEKARPVCARENPDLDADRPDVAGTAAVGPHALLDDALADAVLELLVEERTDGQRLLWKALADRLQRLGAELVERGVAGRLLLLEGRLVQARGHELVDGVDQLLRVAGGREGELLDAGLIAQLSQAFADPADGVVRHLQGIDDHLLGDALGAGLDHQDGIGGAGDHQVELRILHPGLGWVDHHLAVDVAHAHGADGALEGDVADGQRRRGAVDREDGGVVLLVHAEHGGDHLHVVAEAARKKRADGSVGEPAGQDGLLGRPSLTADEAARDLARRVELLLVVAGEREEVDALARRPGHGGRAQDDGVPGADDHRAIGLLGHPAGFDGDLPSGHIQLLRDYRHVLPPLARRSVGEPGA